MSDEENDYLSDKFLQELTAPAAPKTYAERRKEAQRIAALKNEQNRRKSRKQLELEAREEGLRKSLFERAKEDEASGQQNKALAMMMKMGFKPGESLGVKHDGDKMSPSVPASASAEATPTGDRASTPDAGPSTSAKHSVQHRVEPIPLNEWAGKKGIGLGKRAASPGAPERLAKMARMAADQQEQVSHSAFRDRARQEYEERRAQGRLAPAQRTCITLDEKEGREFNILWLNPDNPATFPDGLLDALEDPDLVAILQRRQADDSIEGRMRARMRADALQPLTSALDDDSASAAEKAGLRKTPYSEEDIQEATQFLRLSAKDRLELVLDYLRQKYAYCFWCGTQYDSQEDLDTNCPGPDEDAHD
ncbi:hypothetical protein CERSUDRAFT_44717 [Gelatoporia subvermispora B]|uniref:G-patch domain-containing protein n=1 Tax=Ceriporiopsis subvermispora (strain B) TaxID=914234 RepID=M2RQ51_CERS8|nr:hypothetical protein CERSUDRAFT_44717 [Gelatoporia subvermispora B]